MCTRSRLHKYKISKPRSTCFLLKKLLSFAKKVDADVVCVTDPDGDRLGKVVAKHNGEWVPMSGNQSAAVYLEYILSQLKEQGKLPTNAVMYNTIVTSDLGELVARSYGVGCRKDINRKNCKFIGDKIRKYERLVKNSSSSVMKRIIWLCC